MRSAKGVRSHLLVQFWSLLGHFLTLRSLLFFTFQQSPEGPKGYQKRMVFKMGKLIELLKPSKGNKRVVLQKDGYGECTPPSGFLYRRSLFVSSFWLWGSIVPRSGFCGLGNIHQTTLLESTLLRTPKPGNFPTPGECLTPLVLTPW